MSQQQQQPVSPSSSSPSQPQHRLNNLTNTLQFPGQYPLNLKTLRDLDILLDYGGRHQQLGNMASALSSSSGAGDSTTNTTTNSRDFLWNILFQNDSPSVFFERIFIPAVTELSSSPEALSLVMQIYRKLTPSWRVAPLPLRKMAQADEDSEASLQDSLPQRQYHLTQYFVNNVSLFKKLHQDNSHNVKLQQFLLQQLGRFSVTLHYGKWDREDSDEDEEATIAHAMQEYLEILLKGFCHEEIAVAKVATEVVLHVFGGSEEGARWLFGELVPAEKIHQCMNQYRGGDNSSHNKMQDDSDNNNNNGEDTMQVDEENFGFLSQLEQKAQSSTINYMRYLELVVALASQSEAYFILCQESKLLQQVVQRLERSAREQDILELLNILELVQKLVSIPFDASVSFLIQCNVLEIISRQLFEQFAGDPTVEGFLMAAIGELTSTLGAHLSRVGSKGRNATSTTNIPNEALQKLLPVDIFVQICERLEDSNKQMELISMRVVCCALATSSSLMQEYLSSSREALRKKLFEHLFFSHSVEVQEGFFYGMAQIMNSPLLSLEQIEQFYDSYLSFHRDYKPSTTLTDELLRILKSTFAELRFAAYTFIEALASHPFSTRHLMQNPLFLREMLNRKLETDRKCQEKKHEMLSQLSDMIQHNESLRKMLSNREFIELRTFIHRGPFYTDEAFVLVQEEAA